MPDFAALPPEVNSGRMYAGPGSAPMLAAAAAWDALAGQLAAGSRGYAAVLSTLRAEGWSGSSAEAMSQAAAPYLAWLDATGATAEEAANRARAAAAAYTEAFAATVPPPLVAANRAELAQLVATDLLGLNSLQIAAIETEYETMWVQDAAAMYGYAAASAAATRLTAFGAPPQTTNPADQGAALAQAGAGATAQHAQTMAAVPQQLEALSTAGTADSAAVAPDPFATLLSGFTAFNTLTNPASLAAGFSRTYTSATSMMYAAKRDIETHSATPLPKADVGAAPAPTEPPPAVRPPVAASVGSAAPIGKLSVPPSWAPPGASALLGNEPLWMPEAGAAAAAEAESATSMLGAAPVAGVGPMAAMAGRISVSNALRVGPRRFTMPRPVTGG